MDMGEIQFPPVVLVIGRVFAEHPNCMFDYAVFLWFPRQQLSSACLDYVGVSVRVWTATVGLVVSIDLLAHASNECIHECIHVM